jgi:ubiquinone/menaquinone biosynthesis C-methylase UbiE
VFTAPTTDVARGVGDGWEDTTMSEAERGQVTRSAAEVYDEFFVPALFQQWVGPVVEAAGVGAGQRVLDVACGTGVVARAAADRV